MPIELVRPAGLPDLEAIGAIYAHEVLHGTATFELEPPDRPELERRFRAVTEAAGLPWLVAERWGRVIGYAYAGPYRPRPAYRFTAETTVYVMPEAQGGGIGTALLERLVRSARAAGTRQLVAIIGDSANLASIRLHARCGFRTVGTLRDVGHKFERWLDTVLMQRDLVR